MSSPGRKVADGLRDRSRPADAIGRIGGRAAAVMELARDRRAMRGAGQAAVPRFRQLGGIALALVAWPGRACEAALMWLDRDRQRRTLHRLSDHLLKDIGLSRANGDRDGRRPPWRE
jgi:uncharacterized protein YjiS (DUF1127 family)